MQEIFDRYRKEIITGGGIILFLSAGLITMLLTGSENITPKSESPVSESETSNTNRPPQNQNVKTQLPSSESKQPVKDLYVYVTGEIKRPGVYKLSEDARIFHLIDLAGGFTSKADTESLNLAEFLADGLHIHVGAKLPPKPRQNFNARIPGIPEHSIPVQSGIKSPVRQSSPSHETKIDVNHADAQELEKLNGIGPAIAKRIVEYRTSHGKFSKPEDLIKVKGIGPAKMEKMKSQILIR